MGRSRPPSGGAEPGSASDRPRPRRSPSNGDREGGRPAPLRPLEEELDELLELLCHGEPLSSALARKAEREVRALLLRRGLAAARVAAMIDAGGVVVQVELPREAPRVMRVIVQSGR